MPFALSARLLQHAMHRYGSTYTPAAATVGEKYAIPVISGDSAAEAVFTNETTGRRRFEYLVGLNSPAQRYFGDFIDLMSLQGVKTVGIIAEDASFPAVRFVALPFPVKGEGGRACSKAVWRIRRRVATDTGWASWLIFCRKQGTALGTIYSAADRAMEVVAQVKIPRITELTPEATATLRAALETLRDSGAEAVVSSVYYHACLGLVQQAKLMGYASRAGVCRANCGAVACAVALTPLVRVRRRRWRHGAGTCRRRGRCPCALAWRSSRRSLALT